MRNRMYGGVRGRKTKVGRKLLRFLLLDWKLRSPARNAYGQLARDLYIHIRGCRQKVM